MTSSSPDHQRRAADAAAHDPIRCAVLTVSDTRTPQTDRSGPLAEEILARHGHATIVRTIVRDDPGAIAAKLEAWLGDDRIQVILTTGGTGIGRRDTTIEVVRRLVAVELDGFGELFRMLSYREIAAAAMLSRAVAGLVCREPASGGDTFVFAIPGSTDAVQTATSQLIAPQLAHLVWHRGEV